MKRKLIAALTLSASGFVGILNYEGYTSEAIIPVKGDVPTVGFGTTSGVKLGDKIDPVTAVVAALGDVKKAEQSIEECIKVPLHQSEYDALASFTYNIGGRAFCSSTLVKKLNAGDYDGACEELKRWVYVKGVKVKGLENRREKEFMMCMKDH